MANITTAQQWIIITEPWCGDAAHNVPFLQKAAALNPLINVTYELRDSEPFRINQYLTNGGKSIPKLIIRDAQGHDLATWGPRPAQCQVLYQQLAEEKVPFDIVNVQIQTWYNNDKAHAIQQELSALLRNIMQ